MDIPKIIKYSENGKLFLRAFLLDASENTNKWNVAAHSLAQNIKTFIGTPLVAYINRGDENDKKRVAGEFDHPPVDYTKTLGENFAVQERYAIGRIVDVLKDGSTRYDALIEVTHPAAKEAIENNEIPLNVSPKIFDQFIQDHDITDWLGWHLAVVQRPAYGTERAKFKGACYGSAGECKLALKEAGEIKQDCGFCVKTELLKLKDAGIVSNHNDSSLSSLSLPSTKLLLSMENTPTPQVDLSGYVPKADFDALKTQVDVFKTAAEQAKETYQKQIDALVHERTIEKISAEVRAKISDPKKAEETIKKFVEQKASPELVKDAMALIPEPQRKDNTNLFTGNVKDASANPHAGSFAKAQAYMNSIIRGASY